MLVTAVFVSVLLVTCGFISVLATGRQSRIELIDLTKPTASSSSSTDSDQSVEEIAGSSVRPATHGSAGAPTGEQLRNFVPTIGAARFRSETVQPFAAWDPSPSEPPGLRAVYPASEEFPVLDRHFANILAIHNYRGQAETVPSSVFDVPDTRAKLLWYSNELTEYPEAEYFHHVGAFIDRERNQVGYMHLYQPIAPEHFQYIFPGYIVNDWRTLTPVLALRMRVPQPFPWHYGQLEIAGVELIHHPDFEMLKVMGLPRQLHPQASLRQILNQVAALSRRP